MKLTNLIEISKNLTVLYVEDDESIALRVVEYLNKFFKVVTWAKDGEEGFSKFMDEKYDIVLTDIYMPKMNGLSMLKEIKKLSPEQNCIVISAYSESTLFV